MEKKNTFGGYYFKWAKWTGNGWEIMNASEIKDISPFGSVYIGNGIFSLYAKKWASRVYMYSFNTTSNTMNNESLILHTNDHEERGFSHIKFINNAHPEILGFFIEGGDSNWQLPKPDGILVTFGMKT